MKNGAHGIEPVKMLAGIRAPSSRLRVQPDNRRAAGLSAVAEAPLEL